MGTGTFGASPQGKQSAPWALCLNVVVMGNPPAFTNLTLSGKCGLVEVAALKPGLTGAKEWW
jgi:hypothetical protein